MTYVIGIDIGGTNFRIGSINEDNEVINFEQIHSNFLSEDDVVLNLANMIISYMKKYNIFECVKYISIGLPSIVSKDKSYVYSTPNLPGLNEIDLGTILHKIIKLPIHVDRDVNYLLYHDIKKIQADPEKNKTILGFYYGTGLGNAIYINGKSYQGSNGAAGELGHIPMLGFHKLCTCGNEGCAEIICSGKYLQELVSTLNNCDFSNVFIKHRDNPLLLDYVRNLAIPIATECNILDPDLIIIGGGVVFMNGFPKDSLLKEIKNHLRKPFPFNTINIKFSEHTQQSGVLGGAYYIKDNY